MNPVPPTPRDPDAVAAIDAVNTCVAAKLRELPPETWNMFITTVLGNMVGNMSPDSWHYMATRNIKPCGAPGCNCHLMGRRVQAVLAELRKDFQIKTAAPGKN